MSKPLEKDVSPAKLVSREYIIRQQLLRADTGRACGRGQALAERSGGCSLGAVLQLGGAALQRPVHLKPVVAVSKLAITPSAPASGALGATRTALAVVALFGGQREQRDTPYWRFGLG